MIPPDGRAFQMNGFPQVGKMGQPVNVFVNFFEVASLPIICVYEYEVKMRVPLSSQRHGVEKLSAYHQAKTMMSDTLQTFLGPYFIYDGSSFREREVEC